MDTIGALSLLLSQGPLTPQEQMAAHQAETQKLNDQVRQLQTVNCSLQEQATALSVAMGNHSASLMTPNQVTGLRVSLLDRDDGTCSEFCGFIT